MSEAYKVVVYEWHIEKREVESRYYEVHAEDKHAAVKMALEHPEQIQQWASLSFQSINKRAFLALLKTESAELQVESYDVPNDTDQDISAVFVGKMLLIPWPTWLQF